jgi:hypothetical protein
MRNFGYFPLKFSKPVPTRAFCFMNDIFIININIIILYVVIIKVMGVNFNLIKPENYGYIGKRC